MVLRLLSMPIILLGFLLSCSQESKQQQTAPDRPQNFQLTDPSQAARGQLIEAKRIISLSQADLTERLAALAPLGIKPKNGVHIYKIVYQTESIDTKSSPIQASGVVVVPDLKAEVYPWISLQHGTIAGKIQAPSVTPSEGIVEGSQGFVAVATDYLGYGASSEVFHPYAIEAAYAKAGVDMLKASAEFARQNSVNLGPLFFKGYSEGGYATLALQKALETKSQGEFPYPVLASAPSAGPYDLRLTGEKLMNRFDPQKNTYTINPINVPLVILSYAVWFGDATYSLDSYFSDTPAVQSALSGAYDTNAVYTLLPAERDRIFKPEVAADFLASSSKTPEFNLFKSWLTQQSLHNKDWAPSTQTRLYHCKDDEEVPYEATLSAYKSFKAYNADAPVVPVIIESPSPEAPYRHGTCPAIFAPLQWFAEILSKSPEAKP